MTKILNEKENKKLLYIRDRLRFYNSYLEDCKKQKKENPKSTVITYNMQQAKEQIQYIETAELHILSYTGYKPEHAIKLALESVYAKNSLAFKQDMINLLNELTLIEKGEL